MANTGLALFTYRRPYHTKKVIESLKHNRFDKIYIFQDGLKKKEDEKAWREVTDIIKSVDFVNKEIIISQENKGLANSIIQGINYVLERHDTVIALEDDIVLNKGYATFMNACFDRYKDDTRVTCIAGGGWPVDIPDDYKYDVFFSYRASSAAWGTWKDRWNHYSRDFNIIQRIMSDEKKRLIFEKSGGDITTIINDQLYGKCDSWAIFWTLMQIDLKGVCVMPTKYLANDIGHDGVAGTNSTSKTIRYDTCSYDLPEDKNIVFPDDIVINDNVIEQIKMVLDVYDTDNRKKINERVLGKWVDMYLSGDSLTSYFTRKNITQIYIYGAGVFAKKIIADVKDKIEIKGIIVLDKNIDEFCGYPVYGVLEEVELEQEFIVITPVHDLPYIQYTLTKRFHTKNLLNLEDIVGCDQKRMEE